MQYLSAGKNIPRCFVLQGTGKLASYIHLGGKVGVLIEVPAMLVAVRIVNNSRDWYERRGGIIPYDECCPDGIGLQQPPKAAL